MTFDQNKVVNLYWYLLFEQILYLCQKVFEDEKIGTILKKNTFLYIFYQNAEFIIPKLKFSSLENRRKITRKIPKLVNPIAVII